MHSQIVFSRFEQTSKETRELVTFTCFQIRLVLGEQLGHKTVHNKTCGIQYGQICRDLFLSSPAFSEEDSIVDRANNDCRPGHY